MECTPLLAPNLSMFTIVSQQQRQQLNTVVVAHTDVLRQHLFFLFSFSSFSLFSNFFYFLYFIRSLVKCTTVQRRRHSILFNIETRGNPKQNNQNRKWKKRSVNKLCLRKVRSYLWITMLFIAYEYNFQLSTYHVLRCRISVPLYIFAFFF